MKLTTEQNIHIRETLKAVLSMGESQIVFEQADGTIRTLRCTRDKDIIPSDLVESTTNLPEQKALLHFLYMIPRK